MINLVPIFISLSRVIVAPFIILNCLINNLTVALALVIWSLLSDYLDGALARLLKVAPTRLNTRIDGIADAIFSLAMVAGLFFSGHIPIWLVIMMIIIWWPIAIWRFVLHIPSSHWSRLFFQLLVILRTVMFVIICLIYLYLGVTQIIATTLVTVIVISLVIWLLLKPRTALDWLMPSCNEQRFPNMT